MAKGLGLMGEVEDLKLMSDVWRVRYRAESFKDKYVAFPALGIFCQFLRAGPRV